MNRQEQLKALIELQKQDMDNDNNIKQHRDNKKNRLNRKKSGLCRHKERNHEINRIPTQR